MNQLYLDILLCMFVLWGNVKQVVGYTFVGSEFVQTFAG